MTEVLTRLWQKLDADAGKISRLQQYYDGTQPMSFTTEDARVALGDRFGHLSTNIPRLAVTSLAERMKVTGFQGVDIEAEWRSSDMDQLAAVSHRESLLFGNSYITVWADQSGAPRIRIESPRQMAVIRDPGTRLVTSAIKRWYTAETTEVVLFYPDRIVRMRANHPGATTEGLVEVPDGSIPNILGVVPVVAMSNTDLIVENGKSEILDLLSLVDALNKLLVDLLVSSEYSGRPRRYATGIQLQEKPAVDEDGNPVIGEDGAPVFEDDEVNPYGEENRMLLSEAPEARFGQLEPTNLSGFSAAVNLVMEQISAVSGLPAHYLGSRSQNPASADALRASEAGLTARAESKHLTFGRRWEEVAALVVAVRDGVDPTGVQASVTWADASTRSLASAADAVVKLYSSGLLPAGYALAQLGYDSGQIEEIRLARRTEALDSAALDLGRIAQL